MPRTQCLIPGKRDEDVVTFATDQYFTGSQANYDVVARSLGGSICASRVALARVYGIGAVRATSLRLVIREVRITRRDEDIGGSHRKRSRARICLSLSVQLHVL